MPSGKHYFQNLCLNKTFFCPISDSSFDRGHLGSQKDSSLHVLRQFLKFSVDRRSSYVHYRIHRLHYVLILYWRMICTLDMIYTRESLKYKISIWSLDLMHFLSTHQRLDPILTKYTLMNVLFFWPAPKLVIGFQSNKPKQLLNNRITEYQVGRGPWESSFFGKSTV